ncbi:MAG: hypothetical protein QOI47_1831 [Actinomycetota bacterium]|nr:hypothetical protein [Actinomycetota bacterium]
MHPRTSIKHRVAGAVVALVAVMFGVTSLGALPAGATGAASAFTSPATSVGSTSAVMNGTVGPNGASTSYYFQYGTSSSYGSTTATADGGSSSDASAVSAYVTGLLPGTTYYFQIIAFNAYGTSYGGQATFTTPGAVTANRVQGSNRYETSAAIALATFPAGVPSGNVVLATGADFPDALAGSYLAGQLGAPILLSPTSTNDPSYQTVTSTLATLGATHVYLLGGTAALSSDIEKSLTQTYAVTRIGGATRYETMKLVDEASGFTPGTGSSGNRTAIVATGATFPDALAAGPISWSSKLPIILTDGAAGSLSSQARSVIDDLGVTHFIVLGGSSAIDPSQVQELGAIGTIDAQIAGVDRTDTAARLATYAQTILGFSTSSAILANGTTFADALSAGPWGASRASVYLSETADDLGPYTTTALEDLNGALTTIDVAGGIGAISSVAETAASIAAQGATSSLAPAATTTPATDVSSYAATLNATVGAVGSSTTYYFEYGTSPSFGSTTATTTIEASSSTVSTPTYVSGLSASATYYFRIVATNADGTRYGARLTFQTLSPYAPLATTYAASAVTASSATLNGAVSANGTSTSTYFQYGASTSFGSTTPVQDAGSGTSTLGVSASVTGLSANTTYYVRLVATNAYGTSYGTAQTFYTGNLVPAATTSAASSVAPSSARLNGVVNPNATATSYYFDYGTTTGFGFVTPTQSAGSGSSGVAVVADVTGLASSTVEYFRLVATNAYGTAYGATQSFTTQAANAPTVTSVSPTGGTTAGGMTVTVNGTNLTGATSVGFGGVPATGVVVNGGGTQLTAVSPAGSAGTVDVTVVTSVDTSATNASDSYTYVPTPTMTAAVVAPGTYSSGTASGTTGTVTVTFSEAVTCAHASDYTYSDGGSPVTFASCAAAGTAPTATWVLIPAASTTLAAPSGDSLTYVQAAPTTLNATYATAGTGQVFEASGESTGTLS